MSTTALPSLLNEELIHRALLTYHNVSNKKTMQVLDCAFELISSRGDNFGSDIFAANVSYEFDGNDLKISFVIKIMLPEVAEIGSNEEQMFTVVLPGMEKCLMASNGEELVNIKLNARCLIGEHKEHEFYVLENLKTLGYFCEDRVKGLDEAHARLLVRKIGTFHAASMIYAKRHPEVINSLRKSHFEHGASDFIAQAITFGGLEYVSHMIESWPGYEHLAPKVKNIIPHFDKSIAEVVKPENAVFAVLNHGDLWVNNAMFKHDPDTEEPVDVLFVDFQQSFWGGCGFDLNMFFHMSLQLDVLRDKRLDLIKSYSDSLRTTLAAKSFPTEEIPTLDQVLLDFERNELVGFYTSLCELPIVALERSISKEFGTDSFANPEKMKMLRKPMYANDRVKETLRYTLKYYEENGILQ